MNIVEFDEDGILISPNLHDASIRQIRFENEKLTILTECENGDLIELTFSDGIMMHGIDIRQGNIIFDIAIIKDRISQEKLIERLIGLQKTESQIYFDKMIAQVETGQLKLIQISPSYGVDMVISCESFYFD